MAQTDLLKLIFHHDQRMEQLAPDAIDNSDPLAMFTKPDPTYSTLYFSGTSLEAEILGLNKLQRYRQIVEAIGEGFNANSYQTSSGKTATLSDALSSIEINDMILITDEDVPSDVIHSFSGKVLRDVLEKGWIVLFKRESEHGFDLQVFSKENIYLRFFHKLQALLEPGFRFFSINGKRVHNENFFYFESHRLEKPPHGFEEVFPESVL